MKKILLSLFVVLFMTLAFSRAEATCTYPWSTLTTYFNTGSPDSCEIAVKYCFKTSLTGDYYDIYLDTAFVANPPCGTFDSTYISNLYPKIINAICQDLLIGGLLYPCNSEHQKVQVTFTKAFCWKFHNYPTGPFGGGGYLAFIPCEDVGYCIWVYKLCVNTDIPGHYFVEKELISIDYSEGNNQCQSITPTIPPIGHLWNDEWETDCFSISCELDN